MTALPFAAPARPRRAAAAAGRALLPGLFALGMAVLFNLPYARLAAIYEYPDILRRPAAEALDRFAQGGTELILTWHAFAWAALLLVPLAFALALTRRHLEAAPGLAVAAAAAGALAGVTQAIGLWRWVFVIPALARTHADPAATPAAREAAERAFEILNSYGGVAVGEHLGQLLTALFVGLLAVLQARLGARATAAVGLATAAAIAAGTTEGLLLALGREGDAFALVTIAGFLGLTLWLLLTGLAHLRGRPL